MHSWRKFMMRPLTTNTKPISSCRMNRLFRLASRAMAEEPGGPRGLLSTHYDQPEEEEEEEEEEQHLCQNTRAEVHLMSGAVPYHGGLLYRPRLHGPSANITDLQRKRGAQKKKHKKGEGPGDLWGSEGGSGAGQQGCSQSSRCRKTSRLSLSRLSR